MTQSGSSILSPLNGHSPANSSLTPNSDELEPAHDNELVEPAYAVAGDDLVRDWLAAGDTRRYIASAGQLDDLQAGQQVLGLFAS